MQNKNFEKTLPEGYEKAFHIDAQSAKVGIVFNVIAIVIWILTVVIALLPLLPVSLETLFPMLFLSLLVSLIPMIVYTVLHELVHGIAYKALTGEKLTFGISWSCAYCGVPGIYTYRKTALIALLAPFLLFTAVFLPLTLWLYHVSTVLYLACACLLGLHIGGCCGDIYMTLLLLFKYRNPKALMRDTGPEQTVYLPSQPK